MVFNITPPHDKKRRLRRQQGKDFSDDVRLEEEKHHGRLTRSAECERSKAKGIRNPRLI